MDTFGRMLKAARLKNGFTQQKMADSIGMQLRNYQNYEQGNRHPNFERLVLIADVLNVSTDYLLGRTDAEHADES